MLLAIVLSALVLIGWIFLSDRFLPTAGSQTQKVENGKVSPTETPGTGLRFDESALEPHRAR